MGTSRKVEAQNKFCEIRMEMDKEVEAKALILEATMRPLMAVLRWLNLRICTMRKRLRGRLKKAKKMQCSKKAGRSSLTLAKADSIL